MFLHSFYYGMKTLFCQKILLCWTLLFPIALSTLFYAAFSGIGEDESFDVIPVAVVLEEDDSVLMQVLEAHGEPDEEQFLDVTFATKEEALSLLEQKKIVGIIYGGEPVTLSVSGEMSNMQMEQSILSTFINQYNSIYGGIKNVMAENPDKVESVIRGLSKEIDYNMEITYTDGTMDQTVSYFFNLIAMTCLYSGMAGMLIAVANQANLSCLGERRSLSPMHKLTALSGEICASWVFQSGMTLISLLYINFVLKVDFGSQFGYAALAILVGCFFGISMGFCIGCIGKMSEGIKIGILIVITMANCFLSGLMVQNMRINVEKVCPWYNRINPAALISDSFYALAVYQSHDRYFMNLAILLVMSVCLCIAGFFMVRRKKYAAL